MPKIGKKYLYDDGNGKMISRQRIYQLKMQILKRCILCGKNVGKTTLCEKHRKSQIKKSTEYFKKYPEKNLANVRRFLKKKAIADLQSSSSLQKPNHLKK